MRIQYEAAVLASMMGEARRSIRSSMNFLQTGGQARPQRWVDRGHHQSHLEK